MHSREMKRIILPLLTSISLGFAMPVSAETTYLVIKSEMFARKTGVGLALIKIPMLSKEQCEEAGAEIIGSSRFDTKLAGEDGFECIVGK